MVVCLVLMHSPSIYFFKMQEINQCFIFWFLSFLSYLESLFHLKSWYTELKAPVYSSKTRRAAFLFHCLQFWPIWRYFCVKSEVHINFSCFSNQYPVVSETFLNNLLPILHSMPCLYTWFVYWFSVLYNWSLNLL